MSKSSLAKAMREMVDAARKQGLRVDDKKGGWMVYAEDPKQGRYMVHKTPSKQGAVPRVRSRLRRLGVEL